MDFRNKKSIYILLAGSTEISLIPGISAAGASPGATLMTPVLDSEIIYSGKCLSMDVIPMTDNGIPTPAIITRACNVLSNVKVLIVDSGFYKSPEIPFFYTGLGPAKNPVMETALPRFNEALDFGSYLGDLIDGLYDNIILAESIPGGTTTAYIVLNALGYNYMTSSSMRQNPMEMKRDLMERSFKRVYRNEPMDAVKEYGDYMMAMAIGMSRSVKKSDLIYAGGTQMITVQLLDYLINKKKRLVYSTKYVYNDAMNLINSISLNFEYSSPDFSGIKGLEYYENGFVKEGTGFGAAFALASIYGTENVYKSIINVYNSFLRF
ncbi:nicotinate-nucleotide--dimethylbenzimidazole phosphoribosyltransferase [Picrophilus oshimae]|uniref:UPF0284 protein SAMN02745355_1509 n=1 Tax=Picrophilus torridus (strain ATCC 700027 / DSM 9790 / JCM 10055 / NBRC 100828 / KAW 2/3) TaxID=1122961 RepID=A0A8G2L7X0_PICTO|nr:nicotinate-nucleotide--dimethylbenzimidazole phosphoribosyltransferase [Picrophilus oshimae]SMD31558.1 TIGR00303 family protein [Picrophilus oshimae DSM 9789]